MRGQAAVETMSLVGWLAVPAVILLSVIGILVANYVDRRRVITGSNDLYPLAPIYPTTGAAAPRDGTGRGPEDES